MRLINTYTLDLHEFFDANIPESYATLSHTWGQEEVSFQEWRALEANRHPIPDYSSLPLLSTTQYGNWAQNIEKKAGYKKVVDFCNLCRRDGYAWAWADTCCIDKSSSAELSEAINSMYKWYRRSKRCYAYLVDVSGSARDIQELPVDDGSGYFLRASKSRLYDGPINYEDYKQAGFTSSRWFKRGWTLQELLAPLRVHFYEKNWRMIGTRYQLARLLTDITKIPTDTIAYGLKASYEYPVAEKFSWASNRETSRGEDIAYCLLGLFNIHMPLLYGEGEKRAFIRLQEEIIKKSTDHSIFLWLLHNATGQYGDFDGPVLAPTPKAFKGFGDLSLSNPQFWSLGMELFGEATKSYSLTNNGLQIELALHNLPCEDCDKCKVALLNCWTSDDSQKRIGIYLKSWGLGKFYRAHCNKIVIDSSVARTRAAPVLTQIYIEAEGAWEKVDFD